MLINKLLSHIYDFCCFFGVSKKNLLPFSSFTGVIWLNMWNNGSNDLINGFEKWDLKEHKPRMMMSWHEITFHISSPLRPLQWRHNDLMASQITSVSIVFSTVGSGADQRKHQSTVSLAFVHGIHHWPVNSPHRRPVTWKMFSFDDVIMKTIVQQWIPLTKVSHWALSSWEDKPILNIETDG